MSSHRSVSLLATITEVASGQEHAVSTVAWVNDTTKAMSFPDLVRAGGQATGGKPFMLKTLVIDGADWPISENDMILDPSAANPTHQ